MKRLIGYLILIFILIGTIPFGDIKVNASSTYLLYQINNYKDDAHYNDVGVFVNNMPFIYLASKESGYASGLRFNNTQVPNESYINESKISLYVNTAYELGNHNITIYGIREYNLTSFNAIEDLRDVLLTGSYVKVNVSNINTPGQWYNITVTSIVQEIVNMNNWTLGMGIGFKILSSKANLTRCVCTYETHISRTQGAKLYIIYSSIKGYRENIVFITNTDYNNALGVCHNTKLIYNPDNQYYYLFYWNGISWKYRFAHQDNLDIWSAEYSTLMVAKYGNVFDITYINGLFRIIENEGHTLRYHNATANIDKTLNISPSYEDLFIYPQVIFEANIIAFQNESMYIFLLTNNVPVGYKVDWYKSNDKGTNWVFVKTFSLMGLYEYKGASCTSIELDNNQMISSYKDDVWGSIWGFYQLGGNFYVINGNPPPSYGKGAYTNIDVSSKDDYSKFIFQRWLDNNIQYVWCRRSTSQISDKQNIAPSTNTTSNNPLCIITDIDYNDDYIYWIYNNKLIEVYRNWTSQTPNNMRVVANLETTWRYNITGIRRGDSNRKVILAYLIGTSSPYKIYVYWRDMYYITEEEDGTPPPEQPTPGGWVDYPITRWNFKMMFLILGLLMLFLTPGYLIYERPPLMSWIWGIIIMVTGLGMLINIQYF